MKIKILPVISAAAILACVSITSCKTKSVTKDPCAGITYTSEIKTIIDVNCANTCHSAQKHMHDIDLSSYEGLKNKATDPKFMASIRHEGGATPMPKKAPMLDDATIQKISCWIKNGSPE